MRPALTVAVLLAAAATALAAPPPIEGDLDRFGGWSKYWGTKTGFFHIEQVRGRYWLIDPDGNIFLCKSLALPAGGDPALALALGFNALGSPTNTGLPYTVSLDIGSSALTDGARATADFPDVFHPGYERAARRQAEAVCAPRRLDPWLIGYFTDGPLGWAPTEQGVTDLVDAYLRLPEEAPGRRQLLALLSERYGGDVRQLNLTWGLSLPSLAALGRDAPLRMGRRGDSKAAAADRSFLAGAIIARYLRVTTDAVRATDTNHLLLGPVFPEWIPAEAVVELAQTVDVISLRAPVYPPPTHLIGQVYRDCSKPILLAGFVASPDGKDYRRYLERLAQIPFLLGYQWSGPPPRTTTGRPPAVPTIGGELGKAVLTGNRHYYQLADWGKLKPAFWQVERRYQVRRAPYPITVDGRLQDWEEARAKVMELAVSPYCRTDGRVTAQAYLMWDDGHVYVAGKLSDAAHVCPTLTQAVGADWLELQAGPYSYAAAFRPGSWAMRRTEGGSQPVRIACRAIYSDEAATTVCGYTYEAAVNLPVVVPVGFRFNCGLTLHHYTPDGREVCLSFPAGYSKFDPKSTGEVEVVGPH